MVLQNLDTATDVGERNSDMLVEAPRADQSTAKVPSGRATASDGNSNTHGSRESGKLVAEIGRAHV